MPPDEVAEPNEGLQSTQQQGGLTEADFESGGVTPETPAAPQQTSQPQQPQEAQPLTIRDLATSLGYSFGQQAPQDDYTALAHLISQAREAEQLRQQMRQQDVYRQLGQQLAPKAQQLGQFLQQQEQPKAKPYLPPAFDKRWAELVERNPQTGLFVSKPNVPPSVAEAANAWADWQGKFLENPVEVLQPFVEERATEIARQVIQQELGQFQQQQTIYNLARANADWAYQRDAQGNVAIDPLTGQWQLSPAGTQYVSLVKSLGEMGVADPVNRDRLARTIIASQLQAQQQAPQPPAAQQRQEQAMRGRQPNRNPLQALGAQERQEHPYATEPDKKSLSMRERLTRAFDEEGITSKDLQAADAFYGG